MNPLPSDNDNDGVTLGSGNVLKDLDIVYTPDEWEERCRAAGIVRPYPYAKIMPFKRMASALAAGDREAP